MRQISTASLEQATHKLKDEDILHTIEDLEHRLQRKYLPLFYLREKLQPPLSREDLDRSLFRLENKGHIELSAITKGWRYSEEELNAGIPQRAGSRLFFVNLK